jgi:hypothetical protein
MINDAQEYFVTKYQLEGFTRSLNHILAGRPGEEAVNSTVLKTEAKSTQALIDQLKAEMTEYESSHADELAQLAAQPFAELAYALLAARIRLGIDPEVLGERLGLSEELILEYERTNYANATLQQVGEVIRALGLSVREEILLPGFLAQKTSISLA